MLFTAQGAQFHAVVVVPFPGDQASPGPVAALLHRYETGTGDRGLPRSVPKNQQKSWKIEENPPFLLGFPWFVPWFSMRFLWVSCVCGFSMVFHWIRLFFHFQVGVSALATWSSQHDNVPVLSRLLPQAQKQVTLHHRDLRVVDLRLKGLHHANHRVACSRASFFRGSKRRVSWVYSEENGYVGELPFFFGQTWLSEDSWNNLGKTKHTVEITARISQTKSFLLNRTPPSPLKTYRYFTNPYSSRVNQFVWWWNSEIPIWAV